MLKITQKTYKPNENETFAFVTAELCINGYTYNIKFDEQTKKRFYKYARTLGFKVGKVAEGDNVDLITKEVI